MKKILFAILFTLLIAASGYAQQVGQITQRCPAPNGNFYAFNRIETIGDITYTPCPSRSSIFTGIVDFSGATIVLPGFVTGSGTTNFIPRWTNGAGSVIGNTPFSWNGTLYSFQNTALNATFTQTFTPSNSTTGVFRVGDANTFTLITQSDGSNISSCVTCSLGDTRTIGNGTEMLLTDNNKAFVFNTTGSGMLATFDVNSDDVQMGNVSGPGNGTFVHIDDLGQRIILNSSPGGDIVFPGQNANGFLYLDGSSILQSALGTNGQLLIGQTGAFPNLTTLTAGTGISVTNGAGSITIASTGASSLNSYLAADFTNATTTLNNTLLSVPLAASTKYGCTAQLFVSDSLAADGVKVDFGGGSATFTNFIAGSNTALITSVTNSSTSTFSNATVTGANLITITTSIEANGAGTFIIRAAQVAHTIGTLTVSRGSRLACTQLS